MVKRDGLNSKATTRELDAEIAVRVMGLDPMPEDAVLLNDDIDKSPGSCGSPSLQSQRNFLKDSNYWGYSTLPRLKANYYRRYSNSISDAWLVVEEMRERDYGMSLRTCDDASKNKYACSFISMAIRQDYMETQWAVTAPEAICMASLEAVK